VLSAVLYFALRAFAVPMGLRISITLALIWLYMLVAGASPSTLQAGVVTTLLLVTRFFGGPVLRAPGLARVIA
jgi:hypothetical protein